MFRTKNKQDTNNGLLSNSYCVDRVHHAITLVELTASFSENLFGNEIESK